MRNNNLDVRISVIILNWNGSAMMQKFLPSVVKNTTTDAEVVVADNGSTDDSLAMLAEKFPSVKTIVLDKNYGFAEGYNRAIAVTDSEYVVLLNSDIETPEGWLEPLVAYMDATPDVAACQPKLRAYHNKEMFEYAGAAGGFVDKYGYPFCRGRILSVVEKDEGQYDETMDIHWATGACMMVRTEVYKRLGGLDARFFAHNEEIDLCWRMRIAGYRIACVTDSFVFHVGGGTLPQGNPRKTYLNFRNNLTMLYKNLPEERLSSVMFIRWALDYVAALQSLLKGNIGDVKAIIRARRDFYAWKSSYAPVRREIQAMRKTSHHSPQTSNLSILIRFYARGQKKFSQLRWK